MGMIHHKQRLSAMYILFWLLSFLAASPVGTLYFRKARKRDPESGRGKLWWHFYLLNFVLRGGLERDDQDREPIRIVNVKEYHFKFYNVCFNLSCLSHFVYEYAVGKLPVLKDKFGLWDSFFEQPFSTEAPEQTAAIQNAPFISRFLLLNRYSLRAWRRITAFFLKFNPQTLEYAENERQAILPQNGKVLGVVCRGTDYLLLKPSGHPVQPQVSDVIARCKKWMKRCGYEKIYLATEDSTILDAFLAAFPGQILTNKRSYYDKQMKEKGLTEITQVSFDRENDDYLKGLEYLSSLYILSKCSALVGGNCGASQLAGLLNNGNYERMYIFDKGLY